MEKKFSIREIAARAGVSIGTVDRVLHDRGRVSPAAESRVRRVIAETGYKPNIFASRLSRSKIYRLGVFMPHPFQDSGFWRLPERGIRSAGRELESHHVQVEFYFFDKYSPGSEFERTGQKIRRKPPDGLLIAPVIPGPMARFLHELPSEIPYIFFDTNLPHCRPLSVILQNSFQSGVLSARLMQLLVDESAEVAIVQTKPADHHLLERERGFRSHLGDGRRCRCCRIDGQRAPASMRESLLPLLGKYPRVEGIYVTSALTFLAAQCLRSHARVRPLHVIGYDLTPSNIVAMRRQRIDFIINPRPEVQGYRGIYALYRCLVLGEPVPARQMMPIDIITRENLDDYIG